METTAVKLYSTGYREAKTYLAAALFVAGNIVLPQICHLVPQGGLRWLPIYFFTLVGAYKYGWRVGLLTAVLSPAVNSALFGMPAAAMLPVILLKSVLLAVAASLAAWRAGRVTLPLLAGVVLFTSCSARWANGPGRARRKPPCRTSASGSPVCWHRYLQDTRCSGTYYVINNPET